ncbi:MAG: redoxin domain-containing protein [Acidobacteria bacterium]|nr:redoxin domain-containing protein [Acidobacteriota bacterium]
MRILLLFLLMLSAIAAQPAAKYRQGHSHIGEGFDEGPRQKPWEIAGAGSVSFPITHKNPETQKWFNQGVALLHSFWYYEAERAFRWCLQLEPDNAMAWWGLARSQAGGKRTKDFVQEAVKRKGTVSDRERLYIEADAANALPELGAKDESNRGRLVLERLVMKYPDDIEAKAFLALDTMMVDRIGTELLIREVLAKASNHPGAHHYRIHNWDGKDPEFALESCRRYGDIAPAVGHARHMPGHVFAGAGMWHEAAISMDAATRVEKKYMQERQTFPFENWNYTHNKNYLAYIQSQLGMEKAALSAGRQLLAAPRMEKRSMRSDSFPPHMEAQIIVLRTKVRFERWPDLLDGAGVDFDDSYIGDKLLKTFVEGLAYHGLGNEPKARKALADLEGMKDEIAKKDDFFLKSWHPVMVRELKGKLMLASGKTLEGLTELGEAAIAWAAMLHDQNDPPFYPSNIYDDLGRAYLKAKSPILAVAAYGKSMELVRNNAWALAGLTEAHLALGEKDKATAYYSRLLHVWGDADSPMPVMKTGLAADPKDVSPGPQRNYKRTTLSSLGPDLWEPFPSPKLDALDPKRKRVQLAEYKGRNVLLIFYLGQECAHCLEQLKAVASKKEDFEKRNTAVLAISSNKPEDNADSIQIKDVPFRLLSDERFENAKRFLSYDDFERLELHSTVLIDAQGRVRWAHRGGDPFTDFDTLLKELDRMNKIAE